MEEEKSEYQIVAQLKLDQSFAVNLEIFKKTEGKAIVETTFGHWSTIKSDPFKEDGHSYGLVETIRKSNGLDNNGMKCLVKTATGEE